MIKKIQRSTIILTAGTFVRDSLNKDIGNEYAELMAGGVKFPPSIIFDTPEGLLLVDGFHRDYAYSKNDITSINADVRKGTRQEAIKYALQSNLTHGIRRTNADKRKAAEIAVAEFPKISNNVLADMCGIHHDLISEVRKSCIEQLAESASSISGKPNKSAKSDCPARSNPEKRIGKDGKERSVSKVPQRSVKSGPAKAVVVDATNLPVPPEIIPAWERAMEESNKVLAHVSELRTTLKQAQQTNNPTFREIDFNDDLAKLDVLFADLKRSRPYAVCFACNGVMANNVINGKLSKDNPQHCPECKGRGFISQFYYDHSVSAEAKKVAKR